MDQVIPVLGKNIEVIINDYKNTAYFPNAQKGTHELLVALINTYLLIKKQQDQTDAFYLNLVKQTTQREYKALREQAYDEDDVICMKRTGQMLLEKISSADHFRKAFDKYDKNVYNWQFVI